MTWYMVRRIFTAILVLVFVSMITFFLMNTVPGSPFMNEKAQSPEVIAALKAKFGLDKPLHIQFINYVKNFLKGDFGVSLKMQKNRPVRDILAEMFPTSAKLGLMALALAVCIGVPLGSLAAYNRGNKLDSTLRVLTTLGISIPGFVVASILLVGLSVKMKLLPAMGLDTWKHYIMPVFSMSFYPMCYIGRLSRASMLDAINQDYIRTAIAKGADSKTVLFKHALRNAFIPVLTYLGPLTASILTGSFAVESVFGIPGMGRYFVQSILNRDYPIIMATSIMYAILLIVMNLIVDILYRFVDPRIDITKGASS